MFVDLWLKQKSADVRNQRNVNIFISFTGILLILIIIITEFHYILILLYILYFKILVSMNLRTHQYIFIYPRKLRITNSSAFTICSIATSKLLMSEECTYIVFILQCQKCRKTCQI